MRSRWAASERGLDLDPPPGPADRVDGVGGGERGEPAADFRGVVLARGDRPVGVEPVEERAAVDRGGEVAGARGGARAGEVDDDVRRASPTASRVVTSASGPSARRSS